MEDITSMLIEEINKFPVISFDVFDTLITRNVFTPRDVFYYVSIVCAKKYGIPLYPHRFLPVRQAAELSARKDSGLEDITLDTVYQRLGEMLQLSPQQLELIKQEEIKAEKKFCVPRKEMFDIYQYAISKGKKVFFVSDMYLPTGVIAELLTQCGYTVDNNLLVSAEYAATKGSGNLFEILKGKVKDLMGSPQRILHIGDNFNADVKSAREHGLNAIYIENVNHLVAQHPPVRQPFRPYFEPVSLDLGVSLMLAKISQKFYDAVTPRMYFHPESLFAGSAYNLGYAALGPLLLGTCDWLIKSAKQDKVDRLLFLARDGFILKQAWDIVTKDRTDVPSADYIYASRRGFNIPMLASDKYWNFVLSSNFHSSLQVLIEQRLGLKLDDKIKEKLYANLENCDLEKKIQLDAEGLMLINQVVNILREEIVANASEEKRLLLDYLAPFKNQKLGLVDLGHTGTIPYCCKELMQADVIAYHVISTRQSMDIYQIPYGLDVRGYLLDSLPFMAEHYSLHSHIPLLETLFSNNQQQFIRFEEKDGKAQPIFMEEDESMLVEKRKMVNEVQSGALDFVREYCQARGEDIDIFGLNTMIVPMLLERHFKKPADVDRFIWDEVYFENNFSGWKDKAIFSSSGKYVSLWNEALNMDNPRVLHKKHEEPLKLNTLMERLVYAFGDDKKAQKFAKSPKMFCADSSNVLLNWASKFLKR